MRRVFNSFKVDCGGEVIGEVGIEVGVCRVLGWRCRG